MSRGKASGIVLTNQDARVILGMIERGDRDHDIAAWFGVNQARIQEVKNGAFGSSNAAAPETLPPKGPPGLKGRQIRVTVEKALNALTQHGAAGVNDAIGILKNAISRFDANEA